MAEESSRRASAADVRTGALGGDTEDDALFALHRIAIVVPVGMFAGDAPVVVDQAVHCFRQRNDFGRAVDLGPRAVETVAEGAYRNVRVAARVLGLDGGFTRADDDVPAVVDSHGDRRELRRSIPTSGREHGAMVLGDESERSLDVHVLIMVPRRPSSFRRRAAPAASGSATATGWPGSVRSARARGRRNRRMARGGGRVRPRLRAWPGPARTPP